MYPDELRTPPVPLVSVVGVPELHPQIILSLHTEQPPINTLALPDFSKVPAIGGKERRPLEALAPVPKGILKADWMLKHRTKVPAVLVAFFDREQINSDHAHWLEVCTNIDTVKNVIRGRNTKLLVVIVQPTLYGETNDERLAALRKRAEVDAKHCLTFISQDPTELKRSLARIGTILGELSSFYYREEGRRVKARVDKKSISAPDLAVRYHFKMAYYAEFRRDWPMALRCYESAYTLLLEVSTDSQSLQRTVELKAVAEQLHFKICTLLLHSGKENEAVQWFKLYITRYKQLLGPLEGAFIHWAWVSQQYQTFGELLQSSLSASGPPRSLSDRELHPGFYYQVAASYMGQRRQCFEMALVAFEAFDDADVPDVLDGPLETVGPPLYVGQSRRILRAGSHNWESPTADEYMRHVMLVEKGFLHSSAALALLAKANELYKLVKAPRMTYLLGTEMGREYFLAGDYESAKRCFENVGEMYRKEGWVMLLAVSLGYLREIARKMALVKEYAEYSLELAALPIFSEVVAGTGSTGKEFGPAGPPGLKQRLDVQREVVAILQGVQNGLPVRDGEAGISATQTSPISLEIDLVSPLRGVLSVCVTFHDMAVKPGETVEMTVSLLTHLPLGLKLTELEIEFNQPACNVVLKHSDGVYDLELEPCKWKRLVLPVVSGKTGRLECVSAIGRLGPHATIRSQVESLVSREADALWVHEPSLEINPVKFFDMILMGHRTIQVEEPYALVDIRIDVSGVALFGEAFPVKLHLKSTGHAISSGELQVSTFDRAQPPTTPGPVPPPGPVERYIPGRRDGDTSEVSLWPLKNPIKVPAVKANESWSTTVVLRWTEAAPASLMVSLKYQTAYQGETYDLWVHKRALLECQEPLKVEYRFVAPYRRDSLLVSSMKKATKAAAVLAANETSMLMVNVKNTSSVPLLVFPVHVDEANAKDCRVRDLSSYESEPLELLPEEVLHRVFSLLPTAESNLLDVGTVALKWERINNETTRSLDDVPRVSTVGELLASSPDDCDTIPASVLESSVRLRVPLPPVVVEKAPLVVALQSPPYGLLGVPLLVSYNVENSTNLLQEVNFSVVDAQGFLVSGTSRGTISLPPCSNGALKLELVPIDCGMMQLPQVLLIATQYSASYQPPPSSASIFVYPSRRSE